MKCWGWGWYPFKKNNTRTFCWKPTIRGGYRPWSTAKSAGKSKIIPILSLNDILWRVQNSSIHPSIHPSRCNTGSDTNKNRNAVPLLHIIQHVQCYIHMYKHTYTHTHTHYTECWPGVLQSKLIKLFHYYPIIWWNFTRYVAVKQKRPGPVPQW